MSELKDKIGLMIIFFGLIILAIIAASLIDYFIVGGFNV